jgi:hypothetical protein
MLFLTTFEPAAVSPFAWVRPAAWAALFVGIVIAATQAFTPMPIGPGESIYRLAHGGIPSVSFYSTHDAERSAKLRSCHSSPLARGCVNAEAAAVESQSDPTFDRIQAKANGSWVTPGSPTTKPVDRGFVPLCDGYSIFDCH